MFSMLADEAKIQFCVWGYYIFLDVNFLLLNITIHK